MKKQKRRHWQTVISNAVLLKESGAYGAWAWPATACDAEGMLDSTIRKALNIMSGRAGVACDYVGVTFAPLATDRMQMLVVTVTGEERDSQ